MDDENSLVDREETADAAVEEKQVLVIHQLHIIPQPFWSKSFWAFMLNP